MDDRTMNVPLTVRMASLAPSSVPIISLKPDALISLPPMSAAPNSILKKPEIVGYDMIQVLGRGGEGTVWEAIEKKLDRRVAIKIHSSRARVETAANLWTEAKVAARIGDPSIVTVLDVGLTLDGRRYYTMELVRGTDVADLLREGPLPAKRALEIAADVARAVSAAHSHGVVHRDLKPRNVIIDVSGRARVVDFGIALDLNSGSDRLAGMLAGSPKYMAPEQIRGTMVGPHTDIWAVGVLLFEMLTGISPFDRGDLLDVLAAVQSSDPGVPSARVAGIHRDVDAIVRRCLQRDPKGRFATAAALHECLRGVLEGQQVAVFADYQVPSYRPRASLELVSSDRPERDQADKHLVWKWSLASSPKDLWPFISDTQRFNQAVGLQPMDIVTEVEADGTRKQIGNQSTLGIPLTWQEFPFEWVHEREHSKFRLYSTGPVHGIWNRVTLTPREDGGTDLTHEIWVKTRNLLGRVATFVELDTRLARAVDRYYTKLDEVLVAGRSADEIDAHVPTSAQRAHVGKIIGTLFAQGFSAPLLGALEKHLLFAPDCAVTTLRPFELADRWRTSRQETTDCFIHAASHGLLVPTWNVVCPICRVPSATSNKLEGIGEQSRCPTCATDFGTDLQDSIELVFSPDPAVRKVTGELFCFGAPATRLHVLAQKLVAPTEVASFRVDLAPGSYRVVADQSHASFDILATATGFADRTSLTFDGARLEGGPMVVRAGAVKLTFENVSGAEELFRIESSEKRSDVLTAASALTHPTFRELFAEQLPMPGTCMPVRDLAFVFVRIASRSLAARLGDGRACVELSRLHAQVGETAARYQGSVVPSSLSLVALAFASDTAAVSAAFAIRELLSDESHAESAVAVHHGGCVGVARGGRLEFFGETLHRGEALVEDCPFGDLTFSDTVMANRRVAHLVHETKARASVVS